MNLRDTYTELHEGLPPGKMIPDQRLAGVPRVLFTLGRATQIQYAKPIPNDEPSYGHPFAPHAQPQIWLNESGTRIGLLHGRYKTTTRGIEDRKPTKVEPETLPIFPKKLIDLGRLEKLGYTGKTGSRTRSGTFDFGTAGPTVAHDERGDLWFFGGHYKLPRGKHMRRVMRANPNGATTTEEAKAVVFSAFEVGSVVAVTYLGMNYLGTMLNTKPDHTPRLGAYPYAAAYAVTGLAVAAAVFVFGKQSSLAAKISAGIGAGAVAGGLTIMYNKIMGDRCHAQLNDGLTTGGPTTAQCVAATVIQPGTPAPTVGSPAPSTTPAGQLRGLPTGRGIPGAYQMRGSRAMVG